MGLRLRTRLAIVLLAFSLVPLAIAMAVGYLQSRQVLVVVTRDRLGALASLRIARLRGRGDLLLREARRLQGRFTESLAGDAPVSERPARWHEWMSVAAAEVDRSVLAILDLRGQVVASTDHRQVGTSWRGMPRLEIGRMQTQRIGPHLHDALGTTVMSAVYLPLRASNGTTVAELAVVAGARDLRDWLREDTPPYVRAELFDIRGRALAGWPPGGPRDRTSVPAPMSARISTDDTISVRAPIESGGLELVLDIPEDRAIAPLRVLAQLGIGALGLVGLLAIALAVIFARTLSQPVQDLARETLRVSRGDLRPLPATRRADEIGILWTSTERMRAALVVARDRLQVSLDAKTRSLADREQLIRSLFEVLPEVVIVVGADRRVRAANRIAAEMFGAAIEGTSCHEVIYGIPEACEGCPLSEVLAGRHCAAVGAGRQNRSSEVVIFDLVPLGAEAGKATTAVYSGRIITHERLLQRRLAHQEKMAAIGGLAAGVAHEIGNPLASLASMVQRRQIRAESTGAAVPSDDQTFLEHLRRIERAVKSLTRVARNPGSGRRRALLQDLAERAVRLIAYDPRAAGVRFARELDPSVSALILDEDAWLHALLNLLTNALDAVELCAERVVTIGVERASGNAVLTVSDTGVGMSPDVVARATDPMFTTKPPGRGTGIGLHVARDVAASHGGTLEIHSELGHGTTVRVTVPMSAGAVL